jgi:hypothetical protein
MGCGAGVWSRETTEPGDIAGEFQDATVVNIVQHG